MAGNLTALPKFWGNFTANFNAPAGFQALRSYPVNPDLLQLTSPGPGNAIEVLADQELEIFHLTAQLNAAPPAGANLANFYDPGFELDLLDGSGVLVGLPIEFPAITPNQLKLISDPSGLANANHHIAFQMPYFRFRARDFNPVIRFVQCFFNVEILTQAGGATVTQVTSQIGVQLYSARDGG